VSTEFLAGRNAIREALRAGRRTVVRVLVADRVRRAEALDEIIGLAKSMGVKVEQVPRREIERLADNVRDQGVLAEVSAYPYAKIGEMLALAKQRQELPLLLVLDDVQDPQNVGSLLRTAEAVGVHGVLLPERRAAQVTPSASRASVGAVEHLLIARVTNLVRALQQLKEHGIWVAGVEQHDRSQDYRQVALDAPLALVLGSEGQGMRRLVAEQCDWLLELPMQGQINSLNVSIAGSILLYHVWSGRHQL